jgi:hypothetical protein
MTNGVGEGVAVGGTRVGVRVAVGSAVSVGTAVGLGTAVSVGNGEGDTMLVGAGILVARVSNVGSGLAAGPNAGGLQAPSATAMSSNSTTTILAIFAIRSPSNPLFLIMIAIVIHAHPKGVQRTYQRGSKWRLVYDSFN